MAKCPICGGTGNTKNIIGKPMTEQEYIQSCNTEQLAEWIFNDRVEQSDWWYEQQGHTKAEVVMWLKQPHTVKE